MTFVINRRPETIRWEGAVNKKSRQHGPGGSRRPFSWPPDTAALVHPGAAQRCSLAALTLTPRLSGATTMSRLVYGAVPSTLLLGRIKRQHDEGVTLWEDEI